MILSVDEWRGVYADSWKGLIVPEAFAHPAKFSRTLIQRIYQHVLDEGWLVPGTSTVLDVFGGVSLGAHDAVLAGVQHVAVELEPGFHALALENVTLWERRYGHLPQWVRPVCVQGDSRELLRVLHGVGVDMAESSPPYAEGLGHKRGAAADQKEWDTKSIGSTAYGTTPGNLGNMPPGTVEAVVSSPPFHQSLPNGETAEAMKARWGNANLGGSWGTDYGTHPDQLGNAHGDTFWSSARTILQQTYAILAPGGHAIWVVKAYCRDGKIVDFPGQWRAVCENVGFITLHEHHAMLIEDHGTQGGLFGEDTTHTTERKSFFRRLHERRRPDLAIDYEVIFCMQTPLNSP